MNIAVINIKDLLKLAVKLGLLILIFIFIIFIFKNIKININGKYNTKYIEQYLSVFKYFNDSKQTNQIITNENILNIGLGSFSKKNIKIKEILNDETIENNNQEISNYIVADLPDNVTTQNVEENNFKAKVTNSYDNVEINNQSDYDLTEDMLIPDLEITDKKDVYIYHTHTCESYTPTEGFMYEATGNYRTTDLNYSVVRVGSELTNYLQKKGFNVKHNTTYHDYPSYSGSYDRSLQTIQSELGDSETQIVIDLHRDAVGDGAEYAPTVKINDMYAAQLMFVIGSNGGGLEHPNWNQNLKFAVKVQKIANEMYPGLFRPIILRNSRYNQHIRNCACIIEVGATGNTMEQCILSMQCLANILSKVCE